MTALQRVLMILVALVAASVATVRAEPCLLAYPTGQTVFRYDPDRYEVLAPADPGYNPTYAISGQTLWDRMEGRVAFEVYRAPGLVGFHPSSSGRNEFRHAGSRATLVIDGFSPSQRQLSDVCVLFRPRPGTMSIEVAVNGTPVTGLRYIIPRFVVTTPTGNGFFSDEITLDIEWQGTLEVEIVVFSDRNGNRVLDGDPQFSVIMQDFSVPTENSTWGAIKSVYRE